MRKTLAEKVKEVLSWITDKKICHQNFWLYYDKYDVELIVGLIHKEMMPDRVTFFYVYGEILEEYLKFKEFYPYKNFIDFCKEQLKRTEFNNSLKEIDFSVSKGKRILTEKDTKEKYDIASAIYIQKENLLVYCFADFFWIENLKTGKKYKYHADF